ncbi:ABC transporter permease [Nocardiopsis sp. YSL2]|uniref:ABC transporter permease n=1 Tax=Nocardiopsis sp. YSL2 TaxID=2939492 RepID=UPI0026F4210D|nr:ABC transporter permease [Nocardiopsis sp. YSL2]
MGDGRVRFAGQVPLARRTLLERPGRFAGAVVAVALAVTLMGLITGLWGGFVAQSNTYVDNTGGSLYIVSPGAQRLTSDARIPRSAVETARETPGVRWAFPARSFFAILDMHDQKVAVTVVGYEPDGRGGPWDLAEGRTPVADDEAVVDEVLAAQHGLETGDRIDVAGAGVRVVGVSRGSFSSMTAFVFLPHSATDAMLRDPASTTFVIVGTDVPESVAPLLREQGLAVVDGDEVNATETRFATRAFGRPLGLMALLAFTTGVLVVGLTSYGAVREQHRLMGVVAALGGGRARLYRFAIAHVAATTLAGAACGAVLFLVARTAVSWWRPQFPVVLTGREIGLLVAATVVMALLAGVFPVHGVGRTDPAEAFRDTT